MKCLGQLGTIAPTMLSPLVIGLVVGVPLVTPVEGTVVGQAIAATPKATTIKEAQIRQIIAEMQTASNRRNVDGVMKYLAPKAVVEMTIEAPAAPQSLRLTREEYQQYLQQGFGMTQDYSGTYSNLKIKIAPNGKSATATYRLNETLTLQNQISLNSTSDSTLKFELLRGQVLITNVTTITRIDLP